jgi:nanoRNase/pAp phosphatase (c-di-AMP/oligoRNAs hydrolase)
MDHRGLDKVKIMIYNYIVKLYLKLWGCKMSKVSATKDIVLYLLNARLTDLYIKFNDEHDIQKKSRYSVEMLKIKELADKLEHSK